MFNKDQEYTLTYINNEGKEIEKTITPEKDMSKPEMIMKLKELDNNFYKLLNKGLDTEELEELIEQNNDENKIQGLSNAKDVTAQFKEASDTDYLIVKINNQYYVYDINKSETSQDYVYQNTNKNKVKEFIMECIKGENLEEDYEVLIEADGNKTLFDLLDDKGFEPVEIMDSITNKDIIYGLDIEKADSDAFNNYLSAIAKEIKVIDYDTETNKATVDLFDYIEKHFDLYEEMFDTVGYLGSDENVKDDQIKDIVINIMPGVLNGCLTAEAYTKLS